MKDALKTVLSCSGGVLPDMAYTGMCPHGVLPHKSDGGSRQKILRTLLKRNRNLFYGCVPNSFPPLRGTNSTTTNYMIGSCFLTLSCQGLFQSVVVNLYPNKAYQFWQQSF